MDHTVQLWDTATGAPLGRPIRLESAVLSAAMSPDDRRVLVLSRGYARLFDAGPPLPALSQRAAVAYLTSSERLDDKARQQLYLETVPSDGASMPGNDPCLSPVDALETRNRLYQLAPDFPYVMRIGKNVEMSTVAQAISAACKSEIASRSNEALLWLQFGRALAFLDRTQQAIDAFAHARDAGNAMASVALGDLYASNKQAEKAVAAYEKAFGDGATEAYAALAQMWWDGNLEQVPADLNRDSQIEVKG